MLRIEPLFFDEPPANLEGPWQALAERAFVPRLQFEFPVISAWCRPLRVGRLVVAGGESGKLACHSLIEQR
jgi:hypothetical protein